MTYRFHGRTLWRMSVISDLGRLLEGFPLPSGIEWARNGNDIPVFHQIPSVEFRSWLIVTPKPGDELLVVSEPLKIHLITASEARDKKAMRDALLLRVSEHVARFRAQIADGSAHKIKDCEELP